MPSYDLIIAAVDGGEPALTGSTVVKIQLLDVNDSPPQFSNTNFTATIQVCDKIEPFLSCFSGVMHFWDDQLTVLLTACDELTRLLYRWLNPVCNR
jgi:hypothetical protein